MQLTLVAKKQEAQDVVSFIFESREPMLWRAGQFLHYTLPIARPNGRGTDRYFTIASAPHEKHIMLTTRFADDGSSFKKTLRTLSLGSIVEVDGLDGDFIVDNPQDALVLIAGGIGITPFRSILLDMDYRGRSIQATLLYANRSKHVLFQQELEGLQGRHANFLIHYFFDSERIDEVAIHRLVPNLEKPIFYVSGPEPMVEAFEKMLGGMGIAQSHIKRDDFPGYRWP